MRVLWELRLTDVFDVTIVTLLLWTLIAWVRQTRARFAVAGLGIVFGLYLVADQMGLQLTVWLLRGFFAAAALVLVVIFQDELRRLFERIAIAGLGRRRPRPGPDVLTQVADSLERFAQQRTGALVVIPGRDPLERYLEGGVHLRGYMSPTLLESLFDVNSSGHDGAVVLEGNQISRFAVHLPLSDDIDAVGRGGTRHAAALGLAERTDALCLVVSEERGVLSAARDGVIREIDGAELRSLLGRYIRDSNPPRHRAGSLPWMRAVPARWPEGVLAGALAIALWAALVPEQNDVHLAFSVPVQFVNLPRGLDVASVDPPEVRITLSGPHREVTRANSANVRVEVDFETMREGQQLIEISSQQVEHPDSLRVVTVVPELVRVRLHTPKEPS
ncbi:diadenylate cyclase [Myxococcota bacterium]|nr:diadenylate cyclase [Myxococcota bacterium]